MYAYINTYILGINKENYGFQRNKNSFENNLTITFPSNTSHKSLSTTMNLFKQRN